MSTNDTVLLLASGASGVTPGPAELAEAVTAVCADLARQLIADAEGATKDIRIDVVSAATEDDAVTAARAVSRSNLFKCAIHGEDPNWGRILSAVGTTDAHVRAGRRSTSRSTACWSAATGRPSATARDVDMSGREVVIEIDLRAGDRGGQRLDQRPDRDVRPRELRLLHLTARRPTVVSLSTTT